MQLKKLEVKNALRTDGDGDGDLPGLCFHVFRPVRDAAVRARPAETFYFFRPQSGRLTKNSESNAWHTKTRLFYGPTTQFGRVLLGGPGCPWSGQPERS